MSRVLITGGAGFVGVHLARRLLADGHTVDLVDDFSRGSEDAELRAMRADDGVRLLEADLRRPDALAAVGDGPTHVVHLAAIVGVANVLDRPLAVLYDNVALLHGVVDWARRLPGLERLLFASTSEVYAGSLEAFDLPVPTPESVSIALPDLGHPRTSYMLSKLYGEAICHQSGVPFTIVRPHNVYGPRMGLSHVIPELLMRAHAAADGDDLEVWSVEHRRTFCFVEDAVELIARALLAPACAGETVNVGAPGPEVAIGDVARLIAEIVGRRIRIVPRPPTPGSPARRCADMTKAIALTGHEPRVGLEEGIARTYDWYRAHAFERAGAATT